MSDGQSASLIADDIDLSKDDPTKHSSKEGKSTKVTFDPVGLASSDEDAMPSENIYDSLQQQVPSSALSERTTAESDLRSNRGVRSILKNRKPASSVEKIVEDCLKLLCTSDDLNHLRDLIHSSASKVFNGLCFDQFFLKGECFSSTCDDQHHYKPHNFSQTSEELWNASLYVICHAALPNCQIIENLFQHYASKGGLIRALLFNKCIAKVKDRDRLKLAQFIVNTLSGKMPMRDVITVMLMLNFSELSSKKYHALMEGLGVFQQNTTDYSELISFLNYQQHQLPSRLIVKMMTDTMKHSNNDDLVKSISGFIRRLHPKQKNDVLPIAIDFIQFFGILPENVEGETVGGPIRPKKRVEFTVAPAIREFEVNDCPAEIHFEADDADVDFSDEEPVDDAPVRDIPDGKGKAGSEVDRIARVFGESCFNWLLNGSCSSVACKSIHDFNKNSMAGQSSEDVYAAADFIITQSTTPSIEILKVFIEFLAESNEIAKVLKFRHCTPKLNVQDRLKLTKMVMALLGKQMTRWCAIEKVLVFDVVGIYNQDVNQFYIDEELFGEIMVEATHNRSSIMRCVSKALINVGKKLLAISRGETARVIASFLQMFAAPQRDKPSPTDADVEPKITSSHLKVALYQGAPNKYFLATIIIKKAVNAVEFKDEASDVLYSFLLSSCDRARVLSFLLENCNYFVPSNRTYIREFIGTVGLSTIVRLYENENFIGAAELLNVLKKFRLDLFALPAVHSCTEFNLAIIYCNVMVDTVERNATIDLFFTRLVDPLLKSGSVCPPELEKLTAKMFLVFTDTMSVEESLKLYKGITVRQKSLVSPLHIVHFVEPTLRCTFHRSQDAHIRRESMKLYLDAVECESAVTFQKLTHRSILLITLNEITCASLQSKVKREMNLLHPLIKKVLMISITQGVYHELTTPHINIYSWMTTNEMKVYLLWWFTLYNRARKRGSITYYSPVTINIIQDLILDDSRLPVYHSLRTVTVSVSDCVHRLTSLIKNMITMPLIIMSSRDNCVFDLHPATVQALSQITINLMLQNGYIKSEMERMCTFCFDKLPTDLNGDL